MRAVLLAVLAVVLLSSPTAAKGGEALSLTTDRQSVACNVEQQTIRWYGSFDPFALCPGPDVVNNPTGCPWDVDDYWSKVGSGSIARDDTVTTTLCSVIDGGHRNPVQAEIRAKSDRLIITLDASDGRSWSAASIRDGNEYAYTICTDTFMAGRVFAEIPDSNGGVGVLVTYTLTITAERGVSNVFGLFKYGRGIWSIPACG